MVGSVDYFGYEQGMAALSPGFSLSTDQVEISESKQYHEYPGMDIEQCGKKKAKACCNCRDNRNRSFICVPKGYFNPTPT